MSQPTVTTPPVQAFRTIFLSDLHLGAIGSRADLALDFLMRNRAETYFLVGDILDIWHPVVPHWSQHAQAVVEHLHQRAAEGAQLVYVCGNHDPAPDTAPETRRLPVPARAEALHHAADGRKFLVLHGDCQDGRIWRAHVMTRIGSRLDNALRRLDRRLSDWAGEAPLERRSLIETFLAGVNALFYPNRSHERRLVAMARARGLDGVICGHFHLTELHDRHGLTYANCGDWVDSFTALAEDFDGAIRILGGRRALAGQAAALEEGFAPGPVGA